VQTIKLPLAKQKAELAELVLPSGDLQRQKHVTQLANLETLLESSTRFLATMQAEREGYVNNMSEYATRQFAEHNKVCDVRFLELVKEAFEEIQVIDSEVQSTTRLEDAESL
jgi:hypothetical protein